MAALGTDRQRASLNLAFICVTGKKIQTDQYQRIKVLAAKRTI